MAPAGKTRQRTLRGLGEHRLFLAVNPTTKKNVSTQRDDREMMQDRVLEENVWVETMC